MISAHEAGDAMLYCEIFKNCGNGRSRFNLEVEVAISQKAKTAVFFGPSGSGKTLTMQCIAGLARPDRGKIRLGQNIFYDSSRQICLPPQKRHLGYMVQDYALFPHLTVLQNAAYARSGLLGRRVPGREREKARRLLDSFGIGHLEGSYPREISGGQKQRLALARAVNANPSLLLLDEPFSALDPLLREQMRREVWNILEKLAIPAIIISHDPEDVDAFAGALFLYARGRAVQIPDYAEIRKKFADAAACLRQLQAKNAPEGA